MSDAALLDAPTELVAFRVSPDLRSMLDQAAEAEGMSKSAIIRAALSDWLEARESVTT